MGIQDYIKIAFITLGGFIGWFVAEFHPMFPLVIVAVLLIMSDAWTAYSLDKRAKKKYPDRTVRRHAKFTSFAFGKVIRQTIPKRLWLIFLAYVVEKYVFIHLEVPLSYVITGAICFEQAWSMLENESSCRDEYEGRFWKILQKIMIDKTERHFDIDLSDLEEKNEDKDEDKNTDEQVDETQDVEKKEEQKEEEQGGVNTFKKVVKDYLDPVSMEDMESGDWGW